MPRDLESLLRADEQHTNGRIVGSVAVASATSTALRSRSNPSR